MRITDRPRFLLATGLVLAFAGLILSGCATNRSAGRQASDAGITAKITAKFAADPEINPFNIDVDTLDGVVRLSGTVEDDATRREAVKLANQTDGVRRVVNDVTIGHETFGERLDDAVITSRIEAKLTADDHLNPLNIDVDTSEGVVTLSGRVASQANRERAERIARDTKGVERVVNRLELRRGADDGPRRR